MSLRRLLTVFFLFMLVIAVAGNTCAATLVGKPADTRLDAIVSRIQQHYQATQTLSADFDEQLTGISGVKRVRSGHVDYGKPGKFRWEFSEPEKETIVSDGKLLYDYQPDLDQVLEMPLEQAFRSAAPVAFLLGFGDLKRDYDTTLLPAAHTSTAQLLTVALVPKAGGDRLELGLEPHSYDLRTVKVTDAIGNVTIISFTHVVRNAPLKDGLFSFQIPEGADVIQAPQAPARP